MIYVTQVQLCTGPLSGRRTKFNTRKQGTFYLVAFGVVHDCFIIGAFRKQETANQFAISTAETTGLEISEEIFPGLKHVAGERLYLFRTSDQSALKRINKTKPMNPICFINQ